MLGRLTEFSQNSLGKSLDKMSKNFEDKIIGNNFENYFNKSENLDVLLRDTFVNDFRSGYIEIKGVSLPEYYKKFSNSIENFKVRDDDVWVCSFPKTGTTWTQEMVWCIGNDLDFEAARINLPERFPFLELSSLFDYSTILKKHPEIKLLELVSNSVKFVENLPSPRYIKTHLPFDLLPRSLREGTTKAKIIYVSRNAKDTCISYFNHCRLLEGYRGNFEQFCRLFLGGKLAYCPFWCHIHGFWNRRNNNKYRILFLKYEDMKSKLALEIERTREFMEKSPLSPKKLEQLLDHLSFSKMKSNPAVNYEEAVEFNKKYKIIETDGEFMRSGQTDQWKAIMSPEISQQFDKWTSNNLTSFDFIC